MSVQVSFEGVVERLSDGRLGLVSSDFGRNGGLGVVIEDVFVPASHFLEVEQLVVALVEVGVLDFELDLAQGLLRQKLPVRLCF